MAKKKTPPKATKRPQKRPAKKSGKKVEAQSGEARIVTGDHALSTLYEVSTKSIYNWRREGMPARELPGNQWEYDLDQTDPWVKQRRESGEADEKTKRIKLRKLDAQTRIVEARAESEERDNEIKERNVLDRTAAELKLTEAFQALRDALLRIPTLFHSHLCRKCQPKKDELKKQIEQELKQLAKKLAKLGESDDDD